MLVGLFVSLVTLYPDQIFFCWDFHFRPFFWLNQVVRDFRDFLSLFLSLSLSFLPNPTSWLGGGGSLSPVSPQDNVKNIGKVKMEIPPKKSDQDSGLQGLRINGLT